MKSQYNVILFDVWNILFSRSAQTKATIPPKTLKAILSSDIWFEYECNRFSEDECYLRVAEAFSLEPSDVAEAFEQARGNVNSNDNLISWIHNLKQDAGSDLSIYGMVNISQSDYAVLCERSSVWDIFDDVFTSGQTGMRKPDICFYKHVLRATLARPEEVIFVDDRPENVLSARSLGMQGILFEDDASLCRRIKNLLEDPVQRGNAFLERNAKLMDSVTNTGITIRDNFTQLLLLEATNNRYCGSHSLRERTISISPSLQ